MSVGGVTPAASQSPPLSSVEDTPNGKAFAEALKRNAAMNAVGEVKSMDDKHNQALQEQREKDNGAG